tara:strand:- start:898 stop:1494 length:597 start_codon:yes stop_codon:yes gene_type:complete
VKQELTSQEGDAKAPAAGDSQPDTQISPASQQIQPLPSYTPAPSAEREVLSIMRSRATFAANDEVRTMCKQLLGAGYTPAETASRLKLHPGVVYDLSKEPEIRDAITKGADRRRDILGHGLQSAAVDAMATLSVLMNDPTVPPKERIKAAETLLDRSGLTPDKDSQHQMAAAVSVDVDFDNRLARIVAAGGSQSIKGD